MAVFIELVKLLIVIRNFMFMTTRPKPAYGRQGLDWIVGPGYSFGVFSTSRFVPPTLSSVDDPERTGGEGKGMNKQKCHKQTFYVTDRGSQLTAGRGAWRE